jgi:hypothetical protein
MPAVAPFASQVEDAWRILAEGMRSGVAVALPSLRKTQLTLDAAGDPVVIRETDVLVDSLDSIAALLNRRTGSG